MSKPITMDTTPDNRLNSQVEADSSFLDIMGRSPNKRQLFPTDHEVFLDSQYPLILLNDTSTNLPYRSHISANRNDSNYNFFETNESPKREDSLKKRDSNGRRKTKKSDSIVKRESLPLSHSNSRDSVNGKESDSPNKSMSQSQDPEEKEVDVFHIEEKEDELSVSKILLIRILDSKTFNIIIAICTFYALFAQDISLAFFNKSADLGFDIVSLVTIALFSIEIVFSSYAKKTYVGSFFFFLDIVSTVSIILDINFIVDDFFKPE